MFCFSPLTTQVTQTRKAHNMQNYRKVQTVTWHHNQIDSCCCHFNNNINNVWLESKISTPITSCLTWIRVASKHRTDDKKRRAETGIKCGGTSLPHGLVEKCVCWYCVPHILTCSQCSLFHKRFSWVLCYFFSYFTC